MSAMAISNNDIVFLAWDIEDRIDGCLGFAIYRMEGVGQAQALPAWVGFEGDSNPGWKRHDTAEWPIQKFTWKDLTATRGRTYTYRIVPMVGTPGNLTASTAKEQVTNSVEVTAERGKFSAYFNRGILSTQSLRHEIPIGPGGAPNYVELRDRIDQPGDPLRNRLSGELREAMLALFNDVGPNKGQLYLALYELTDTELESALLAHAKHVHVVLSNTGADDKENAPARQALHEANVDITDRMVGSGHIGHNKFAVLVDSAGDPRKVWTGSTNWTDTGLCAQSNNGLLIDSPQVAQLYLDYWKRLKADDAEQSAEFRAENNHGHDLNGVGGGVRLSVWFSPNTGRKRKPAENPDRPSDMAAVFDAIVAARKAILFLLFQPGSPSIVDAAVQAQNANPQLFVHGASTDPGVASSYETNLFHRTADRHDTDVVAAAAIEDQFGYWEKELLKSGPRAHAIIHDKIVVIDPFADDCVVITGSHNLGYTASYANDENLVIVRGNKGLAAAYAAHVMDVYDHYRWRFTLQKYGNAAWTGLRKQDGWQDKYLKAGSPAKRELEFWLGK